MSKKSSQKFVHLHVHSYYSLLESAVPVKGLVKRAVELGQPSIALTDSGACGGLYQFSDVCHENGVKPILGIEIHIVQDMLETDGTKPQSTAILLAKNKVGWQNICKISSEASIQGYHYAPRADLNLLSENSEGLIVIAGGSRDGLIGNDLLMNKSNIAEKKANWFKDIWGDDFYLEALYHPCPDEPAKELMEKNICKRVFELAEKTNIKCIVSNDVRYLKEKDSVVQDAMTCIKDHKVMKDDERARLPGTGFYLKSADEMEALFPDRPDLLANTVEISDKIEDGIIEKNLDLLPRFSPPDGLGSSEYLRKLVYDGLKKDDLFDKPGYKDRVDYELKVFETCGFVDYFLILDDFVSWAYRQGIGMGPGRGSAAGSLCLYALKVVKLDPIKYDLLFERFFSVDTTYRIHPSCFGLKYKGVDKIEVGTQVQYDLLKRCEDSCSEFDKDVFTLEGKKMNQMGCLDDFLRCFVAFEKSGGKQGDTNECNSSIAYYTGMTSVKPMDIFRPVEEMVAARLSPPDVDLDFDDKRRDEVYVYLKKKYGDRRAVQIATYTLLKARSIVKDVGKALDIGNDWEANQEIKENKMSATLRGEKADKVERPRNTLDRVDALAKFIPSASSFREAYDDSADLRKRVIEGGAYHDICMGIDGAVRHRGVHAAGIVLGNRDIQEVCPLTSITGVTVAQWDKEQVEELGLYKYDLLSVKNIAIISQTLDLVKANRGEDIDIDTIEPDDQRVFKMLNQGKTRGVFQFEGGSVTKLIKNINIDNFNDMVAVNAINRPGPLRAGVGDSYAECKHGHKEIEYLHESMKNILKETYGTIIYQEQVMKLSKVMAGFTTSESDGLRKAVGKKKPELMANMKNKFLEGCDAHGIGKSTAIEVWQMIDYFGGYGFNKSHSLAYSFVSYQTAWLKFHYPIEFFSALLTSAIGDEEKTQLYINEACGVGEKGLGVNILPINVNKSTNIYEIEGEAIRCPLTVVGGVGDRAVEEIIEKREQEGEFIDFKHFVNIIEASAVTVSVIRNLAQSRAGNAFAPLGIKAKDAEDVFTNMKKDLKSRKMRENRFVDTDLMKVSYGKINGASK